MAAAVLCTLRKSAEICAANSNDSALNGRKITIGANTVSSAALTDLLPRMRRRIFTRSGNSRKARIAAQVAATANGAMMRNSP
jgi:hypothetical protein